MAYSHSPGHGAIQDVRIRTLYSKFVEKRERSNNCKGHSDFVTELCNEPIQGSGNIPPVRARGVKSRMCPPYPQRDRKRRLNGAVCRNHRIKRVVPCRC